MNRFETTAHPRMILDPRVPHGPVFVPGYRGGGGGATPVAGFRPWAAAPAYLPAGAASPAAGRLVPGPGSGANAGATPPTVRAVAKPAAQPDWGMSSSGGRCVAAGQAL